MMATTKKTGAKKPTKRNAGKTAKAGTLNVRRCGPKAVAAAIAARGAGFWADVQADVPWRLEAPTRAAQVMPRETPATH
jgi:hypothetical protein